jgi:hypothetical protein
MNSNMYLYYWLIHFSRYNWLHHQSFLGCFFLHDSQLFKYSIMIYLMIFLYFVFTTCSILFHPLCLIDKWTLCITSNNSSLCTYYLISLFSDTGTINFLTSEIFNTSYFFKNLQLFGSFFFEMFFNWFISKINWSYFNLVKNEVFESFF